MFGVENKIRLWVYTSACQNSISSRKFWQGFLAGFSCQNISRRKFWHVAKILVQNFGMEFWHENCKPKPFCAKILSQNFGTVPKLSARNDISAPR